MQKQPEHRRDHGQQPQCRMVTLADGDIRMQVNLHADGKHATVAGKDYYGNSVDRVIAVHVATTCPEVYVIGA